MFEEFKKFALKGNVVDLAVGVVIGGAFGKIVTSLVNDIIMPAVGLLLGKVDFSNLVIPGAPTIKIGLFLNNIVDFLIISFSIFFVIRQLNRLTRKKEKKEEPTTKKCPYCCSEIAVEAVKCAHCTSDVE